MIITLFSDSDLPKKGWFQCCVVCGMVTSRTTFFKKVKGSDGNFIEIRTYLCHGCKNKLTKTSFFDKYVEICYEEMERIEY